MLTGLGSSRGIVRAIAARLPAGGWRVTGSDLRQPGESRSERSLHAAGVRSTGVLETAADAAVERSGRFDPPINDASVDRSVSALVAASDEGRRTVLEAIADGDFGRCRAAVRRMLAADGGRGHRHIVSICSQAGRRGSPHCSGRRAAESAALELTEAHRRSSPGTPASAIRRALGSSRAPRRTKTKECGTARRALAAGRASSARRRRSGGSRSCSGCWSSPRHSCFSALIRDQAGVITGISLGASGREALQPARATAATVGHGKRGGLQSSSNVRRTVLNDRRPPWIFTAA